ncbi:putative lipoprotein [Cystobacter fuscus DSM 2262]|uniref:Lipoprotein n=1 Tax=Cystobacter fuscus (strain ATCC 25194 / DSM 2262 / NBRC 100088 / M29) TaxID=1242864 RepID=S9QEG3_CYSF2|nr:hypothetical protein [Cystobacter fuscus]EPX59704.1 putative lipoprotein [Cystobacter fuscus DSM 2262]
MHSTRLRLLFARTLRASLLSPLMLSGCGIIEPGGPCGEPEPYREQCPGVELTGYTLPACNKNWLAMSGLSPALPPDVVQLRLFQPRRLPDEVAHPVVSASGTACATASEPSTCQSALDQLKATQGFHGRCEETCSAFYLATTRGDEVAAHASLQELKNFLGTIDTPRRPCCSPSPRDSTWSVGGWSPAR